MAKFSLKRQLFYDLILQSRCAMLRYSKLTDAQILAKLLEVCEKEKVEYTEDGMEAVIFTSQASILQTLPLQPVKPLLNWLTESRQLSISISM